MATDFMTLHEIVKAARANLSHGVWDYLIGGAESETSLKRNRLAFDRRALKARVLNDVSEVSVARTVLGVPLRIPVLLAPIGSIQVFEAGGGASVAAAAESFGVMQILSSVCTPDFETLARQSSVAKIYQLYALGDEAWMMDLNGCYDKRLEHAIVAWNFTPNLRTLRFVIRSWLKRRFKGPSSQSAPRSVVTS